MQHLKFPFAKFLSNAAGSYYCKAEFPWNGKFFTNMKFELFVLIFVMSGKFTKKKIHIFSRTSPFLGQFIAFFSHFTRPLATLVNSHINYATLCVRFDRISSIFAHFQVRFSQPLGTLSCPFARKIENEERIFHSREFSAKRENFANTEKFFSRHTENSLREISPVCGCVSKTVLRNFHLSLLILTVSSRATSFFPSGSCKNAAKISLEKSQNFQALGKLFQHASTQSKLIHTMLH